MTLGNRIRVARKRFNPEITQKVIAKKFGITVQAVSGWERDETQPELLTWLLEGKGRPPDAEDISSRIELLSDDQKETLLHMLDGFEKRHARSA